MLANMTFVVYLSDMSNLDSFWENHRESKYKKWLTEENESTGYVFIKNMSLEDQKWIKEWRARFIKAWNEYAQKN